MLGLQRLGLSKCLYTRVKGGKGNNHPVQWRNFSTNCVNHENDIIKKEIISSIHECLLQGSKEGITACRNLLRGQEKGISDKSSVCCKEAEKKAEKMGIIH